MYYYNFSLCLKLIHHILYYNSLQFICFTRSHICIKCYITYTISSTISQSTHKLVDNQSIKINYFFLLLLGFSFANSHKNPANHAQAKIYVVLSLKISKFQLKFMSSLTLCHGIDVISIKNKLSLV